MMSKHVQITNDGGYIYSSKNDLTTIDLRDKSGFPPIYHENIQFSLDTSKLPSDILALIENKEVDSDEANI